LLSGTEETVTLPSCDASAPIPRPRSRSGTVTMDAVAFSSTAARSTTSPANIASSASRTTRRGLAFGRKRGIPAAAASRVIERGSKRTPVSIADRPSDTERKSGTTKKTPDWMKYWKRNIRRPVFSCGTFSIPWVTSGS
jgi:hypothetical protein